MSTAHVSHRTWPGGARERRLAATTIRVAPFRSSAAAAVASAHTPIQTQLVPLASHELSWHSSLATGLAVGAALPVSPAAFAAPQLPHLQPPPALALEVNPPPLPSHPVTFHLDTNDASYQSSPPPSLPLRSSLASPVLPFGGSPVPPRDASPHSFVASPLLERRDSSAGKGDEANQLYRAGSSPTSEFSFPEPTDKHSADSFSETIQLAPFEPPALSHSNQNSARASPLSSGSVRIHLASSSPSPQSPLLPSPLPRSDVESAGSASTSSADGLASRRASPKAFEPSSFFMDAMASPPPASFEAAEAEGAMQWSRMQERSDEDDEGEAEEEADDLLLHEFASSSAQLDESGVGAIGDVSMHSAPATDQPASAFYHPIMLQEEFESVRVQDETMQQDEEETNRAPPRRRKTLAIATSHTHTLPSTPVLRPKRLAARRNSEVVQSTNNNLCLPSAHAAAAHAAFIPAAGMLRPSPLAIPPPLPPEVAAAHRPSLKRKSLLGENDKVDSVAECELCSTCADCAKHWKSDAKHDHSHGHVHPRPSAPNTPLVTVTLRVDAHDAPMLISPAHSTASAAPSPTKQLHRNSNGGAGHSCCKPNFAVRTGLSLNDSPKHTPLALGPASSNRRQHHKMLHGHAYEVSRLLDVRMRKGEVYYLVAWKGFPDIFHSWEPQVNLEKNCLQLLEAFEEENGKLEAWTAQEEEGDDQHAQPDSDDEDLHSCSDIHQSHHDTDDDEHDLSSSPPLPSLFARTPAAHARPSLPLHQLF